MRNGSEKLGMIKIRIKPQKKLFLDEESYFGIYSASVNHEDAEKHEVKMNNYQNISIKGVMPKLTIGQEYTAVVTEEVGSKFVGSYNIESIRQDKPTTVDEQKDFFQMLLTPLQVKNIFDVYEGQDVIDLIQTDKFDYSKVKGLGKNTYEKMKEKVLTSLDLAELLVFLGKHGIKYNMVAKLVKKYVSPQLVIEKITNNPYVLTEVKGIGFKTADVIAKAMGYDMKSPHRIDSAIKFAIEEENNNGHSWVSRKMLLNKAIELLTLPKKPIEERLDDNPVGVLKVDDDRYSVQTVFDAEELVAMKITQMNKFSTPFMKREKVDEFLADYCKENSVELEENQHQFFHDWNENSVTVLVGGGGMGKSWLMNILLQMIRHHNQSRSISLLSPTGKASKVMAGYTNHPASTIHRRAGVRDEESKGSKEIWDDVLIVDESSMCDIFILAKLFTVMKNTNSRILFVGDDFQLPSVGVGNFLYDMIQSECIKISRLKKVFRQASGGILDIATKVRSGQRFLDNDAEGRIVFGKDCVFFLSPSEYVEDGLLKNYSNVLKKYKQEDIAILTPTNKGKLGAVELNKKIQQIANPESDNKKEKAVGRKDSPTIYRVGDVVMNTMNTYEIETVEGGIADIFNGDTGKIIDIDDEEKVFIIDFEGIVVKMPYNTILSNLIHGWVTTIHKSQGSQYKVVIVIIDRSASYQLNANLMYTGFSRAKEFMLVLGQAEAINHGIGKFINMERRSFLQELLQSALNGEILEIQGQDKQEYIEEDEVFPDTVLDEKMVSETPKVEEVQEEEEDLFSFIADDGLTEEEDDEDDFYM